MTNTAAARPIESKLSLAFTKNGSYLTEDDEPEYIILPIIVAKRDGSCQLSNKIMKLIKTNVTVEK